MNSISYMSGLEVKTQDFNKEINEIASYGSKEAYEASLPQAQDEFNLVYGLQKCLRWN